MKENVCSQLRALRHGEQNHNAGQDHEIGVKKDEYAGVVKTPLAPQTASRLRHAPRGYQKGKELPMRTMQVFDGWKTGQAQTCGECAQREQDGAQQRFLPQTEDVRANAHNLSL